MKYSMGLTTNVDRQSREKQTAKATRFAPAYPTLSRVQREIAKTAEFVSCTVGYINFKTSFKNRNQSEILFAVTTCQLHAFRYF